MSTERQEALNKETDFNAYLAILDNRDKEDEITKAADTTNVTYIGIIGSRKRNSMIDQLKVNTAYNDVKKNLDLDTGLNLHIVSGGASTGADRFAELLAKSEQIPITIYYPKWRVHNNSAAMIRNNIIAKQSDYLIACRAAGGSAGTDYTILQFKKKHNGNENILKSKLHII